MTSGFRSYRTLTDRPIAGYGGLRYNDNNNDREPVRKVTVHFDSKDIDDLGERIARTRLPKDELQNGDHGRPSWEMGTNMDCLRSLLQRWQSGFDWREWEEKLNSMGEHILWCTDPGRNDFQEVGLAGIDIHAIHRRSSRGDAIPLLLTHGWPGSVLEFWTVIDLLAEPKDPSVPAFHVVCPSLPGYGFSGSPTGRGCDIDAIGLVFGELMTGVLGYKRFVAQGGDWGSMVSRSVARQYPKHCCGLHQNMAIAVPPPKDAASTTTPDPRKLQAALEESKHFNRNEVAYQKIQQTKPQTLGVGLSDSPAGLLSWIVEKFHGWGDTGFNTPSKSDDGRICGLQGLRRAFGGAQRRSAGPEADLDIILANVTLYWLTNTITSSCRLYYESLGPFRHGNMAHNKHVQTPTAALIAPAEMSKPIREWLAYANNLKSWTELKDGGHFLALEEPEALVKDLQVFVREHVTSSTPNL
eukprot:Clim_evm129s109 gene=Clim_evmTU129s109